MSLTGSERIEVEVYERDDDDLLPSVREGLTGQPRVISIEQTFSTGFGDAGELLHRIEDLRIFLQPALSEIAVVDAGDLAQALAKSQIQRGQQMRIQVFVSAVAMSLEIGTLEIHIDQAFENLAYTVLKTRRNTDLLRFDLQDEVGQ